MTNQTSKKDLNNLLSKIDLTETQRKRAEDLYTNICKAIESKTGLSINFYPQGSFATRTAVRPYSKSKNQSYDVDVICEVVDLSKEIGPKKLMSIFEDALSESRYTFIKWEKCFTIKYEKQEGVDFSIDIIPATKESIEAINRIRTVTENVYLVDSSIAIPDVSESKSRWISNNPIGYVTWFNTQTASYERIFESFRDKEFKASITDIPEDSATNMMRNVIKILKRLRDVYYVRKDSDNKPSSIVITTIVAKLSNRIGYVQDESSLLDKVVIELQQLRSSLMKGSSKTSIEAGYFMMNIVNFNDGQWTLKNPANGLDNILSSWNENKVAAEEFFSWVENLSNVISQQKDVRHSQTRKELSMADAFGFETESNQTTYEVDSSKARPWGE
ncbi:nucleotidyltransferase domain-containing protein [Erysipelothrix aquatica]|uniref:nucleotidyltransferase domain-containing protein n=1 Tax=Erysipelothrix aquatica TaxID=2683714 RepID=UPI00135B34CA|nr:nucleotidyltransferase [Erysipelothrix aquatica]